MSDRRAVLLLLYDLPNETAQQRHAYYEFRKAIKNLGYTMVQESVYVLLLHNTSVAKVEANKLFKVCPAEGTVSVLPMPLSTFEQLMTLRGIPFSMDLFADDIIWR